MPNTAKATTVSHPVEQGDKSEFRELIDKILKSDTFTSAPDQTKLLRFMFDNRMTPLQAKEIEADHFLHPIGGHEHDSSHSRGRIMELKKNLKEYARQNRAGKWRCEVPRPKRGQGYQLVFASASVCSTVVECFWNAHLNSDKDISIICDPLLFFYDKEEGSLTRFVNTNVDEPSREAAMAALKKQHKQAYSRHLVPGNFYLDIGTVTASECLRSYFWQHRRELVPLRLSSELKGKEFLASSPVLLGTSRTSKFIRKFFESDKSKALPYRLHPTKFDALHVTHPTLLDKKNLGIMPNHLDAAKNATLETDIDHTFGIVTRAPNPGGTGTMTIISSDATFSVAQIAAVLSDERQMSRVFAQVGIPFDTEVPSAFQWVFKVQLWPGNFDDEAGEAELVAWYT